MEAVTIHTFVSPEFKNQLDELCTLCCEVTGSSNSQVVISDHSNSIIASSALKNIKQSLDSETQILHLLKSKLELSEQIWFDGSKGKLTVELGEYANMSLFCLEMGELDAGFSSHLILTFEKHITLNSKTNIRILTVSKAIENLFNVRYNQILKEYRDTELIDFTSPFYLILNEEGVIQSVGSKMKKIVPEIKIGDSFFSYFQFVNKIDLNFLLSKKTELTNKLFTFDSIDSHQRYKFSVKFYKNELFISAMPLINQDYLIRSYPNLVLTDFPAQDYISEYIFTRQTIGNSLAEANKAIDMLRSKNEALSLKENELVELNSSLEKKVFERTRKLEQKNKELENYSYSVAHDLRSPLRQINGNASILLMDLGVSLDSENLKLITQIKQQSVLMGSIIDDLLNLAKIGIQEINKTNFSLTELTNQLILNFQLNSDIKKFTFVINDLGTIHADKSLVIYALNNLLSNAIKYSSKHENPVIEIGKIIHEELPTYYVKDNGVGFNKENAKRMFKPFQRFHHESDFEGNGIGLSIVRIIIEKHGGNIWAESEENKGAEFYFNFKNN